MDRYHAFTHIQLDKHDTSSQILRGSFEHFLKGMRKNRLCCHLSEAHVVCRRYTSVLTTRPYRAAHGEEEVVCQ